MQRVVCDLDDSLYEEFKERLGDIPVAKAIRRMIREFVDRGKDGERRADPDGVRGRHADTGPLGEKEHPNSITLLDLCFLPSIYLSAHRGATGLIGAQFLCIPPRWTHD